jgi:PhnB protein
MNTHLIPYLNFNGNAREALSFYKDCFGGDLQLMTIAGSPMEAHFPPEKQQNILHGQLNSASVVLMASDVTPGPYQAGNNSGIMVACATEAECRKLFDALAAGGQVFDPLGIKFWGALFGVLTDRFGCRWMLGWDPNALAS